ncbi:uncharacterized protein LOC110451041 [Mizuhopecten yessoensis]|uniref:uncharacterized protein LOC110451041 n=1 Tax=Mizuhopecten yessoensis TaxID=6573 RepID=UPI000B45D69C|nr:uncharacterized protein LOC110451041 [Mizuhopecten yessoensis]
MIWCWSLLFGIFFNILKASMSSVPRMTFPIACMHDAADVISLNKKEDVRLTVVHHTQSWMMVLNRYRQRCEEKSCNTRTSVICQKTFDMSRLLKRNTKLYIKVKLEQNIHYSCPFTYLLYSGNSIQPIKVIQCWEPFSRTLHWPDTNFTLGVKFNLHKAGINLTDTNIFLRAGTCRNCFKMELPIAGNILEKTWQVNLPIECATRACLEYKPFFYTIQAFSGLYINEPSQAPCYVTFDIMDDSSRGARVTTCLRLSPKKYGVLPYDNKLLLVLKLDAVTYMEFTTGGLDDWLCNRSRLLVV